MSTRHASASFEFAAAILFALMFHAAYAWQLHPMWDYYGFTWSDPSALAVAAMYAALLAPAALLRSRSDRPSELLTRIVYYVVYVPSVVTMTLSEPAVGSDAVIAALLVAMIAIAATNHLPLPRLRLPRATARVALTLTIALHLASAISLLIVYRHYLSLTALDAIYDQRSLAGEVQSESPIVAWAGDFLYQFTSPALFAVGLARRDRRLLITGASGFLIIYAAIATKAAIFYPIYLLGMHACLKRTQGAPSAITAFLGLSLAACVLMTLVSNDPITQFASNTILMRLFGNSGLCTKVYYLFCLENPHTHWSNVKGLGLLSDVNYHAMYERDIYNHVGDWYWGNPELTANAHFFAQDGLVAFGTPGVLIVGLVVAVALWATNVACRSTSRTALLFSTRIFNLSNNSFFTSLLSGGFFLTVALAMCIEGSDRQERPSIATATADP